VKSALFFVWQLPQNLIGLAAFLLLRRRGVRVLRIEEVILLHCLTRYGGVSLGCYVLLHREAGDRLVRHELGHVRQSRMLGPLYLPAVGLPSMLWALAYSASRRLRATRSYFSFATERWADRLGGILRVEL